MVYRTAPHGAMLSAGTLKPAYGPYAKLVRSADTFTGYCSPDGQTWTKIGQVALSMDEKVEMGMAVCSGDPAALAEATFSAFSRVESPPIADSKTMNAAKNLYVDANRGNDSNPGTLRKPLKTIQQAAKVMEKE